MTFRHLQFPHSRLAPGQDVTLARAVEAGCYAAHLLEQGDPRPGLAEVVAAGQRARDHLFCVGARIAIRLVGRVAPSGHVPHEDLFQEACVTVAEAIERYDFRRGTRFTTFVYECLLVAISSAVRRLRFGPPCSRRDREAAARVVAVQADRAAMGERLGLAEAAALAGVSQAAAARGVTVQVSLDETTMADPAAQQPFEDLERVDFLSLLPAHHRAVLELRFGLTGPPLTLAQVAAAQRTSTSTVARWERKALASARRILERDRTRCLTVTQARRPTVPCGAFPTR